MATLARLITWCDDVDDDSDDGDDDDGDKLRRIPWPRSRGSSPGVSYLCIFKNTGIISVDRAQFVIAQMYDF